MGPTTSRLRRCLRRVHHGPGGYCRHSGNRGPTSRPARAHYSRGDSPRRTSLSRPKRALQAWRNLYRREGHPKGFPRQGISGPPTRRTWTLHPAQSHGRAAQADASTVVAVLVYKAASKAKPQGRTTRLAALVLGGAPAAADAKDVTEGAPLWGDAPPSCLDGGPNNLVQNWLYLSRVILILY